MTSYSRKDEMHKKKMTHKCTRAEHSLCEDGAEGRKRHMINKRYILYQILFAIVHTIAFCTRITTVWASSRLEEKGIKDPVHSLMREIASIQEIRRNQQDNTAVNDYIWSLLEKTNPALAEATDHCFSKIYKEKEYADLDIAKYSLDDIKYMISMPKEIHALRILDSSSIGLSRKQRNKVFVKLLHAFSDLSIPLLVIENIHIEEDELELLAVIRAQPKIFQADRLVYHNVTRKTIKAISMRLGSISVGCLCIQNCRDIWLNDIVTGNNKYLVETLELFNVKIKNDCFLEFLCCIEYLRGLRIFGVLPIPIKLVMGFLNLLIGSLEMDWCIYEQIPKKFWVLYGHRISMLHLRGIIYSRGLMTRTDDTRSELFATLTTLTLSVPETRTLKTVDLLFMLLYAAKSFKRVKNVTIMGKIDMVELKNLINTRGPMLIKALLLNNDAHFTFADATELKTSKKHLLLLPLSLYINNAAKDTKNRIGMLSSMCSWDWRKKEEIRRLCKKCRKRNEGYVTLLENGEILCRHKMIKKIQQEEVSAITDQNVYLENSHTLWYPKQIIFLTPRMGGLLYLAETRDVLRMSLPPASEQKTRKRKAESTPEFPAGMYPVQNATVSTSTHAGLIYEQNAEPQPGPSRRTESNMPEYAYALSHSQPANETQFYTMCCNGQYEDEEDVWLNNLFEQFEMTNKNGNVPEELPVLSDEDLQAHLGEDAGLSGEIVLGRYDQNNI